MRKNKHKHKDIGQYAFEINMKIITIHTYIQKDIQ